MAVPLDIKCLSPRTREFVSYWEGLIAKHGSVPTRRQFDPTEIPKILPNLIMHDLTSGTDSILRLVGTGLTTRLGVDPTGQSYLTLVKKERREAALDFLLTVARHPCGMRVLIDWGYKSGKYERAESIGFPMIADGGREGLFLLFCDDIVGEAGYRAPDPDHRLETFEVPERQLIDIGHGIPDLD